MLRKRGQSSSMGNRLLTISIAITISLLISQLMNCSTALAGTVSCYCYCGISLPAPCGDEDCKRACGWKAPSTGGNTPANAAIGAIGNAISSSISNAINQSRANAERQNQQILQEQQQMMQSLDQMSRDRVRSEDEMLRNAADQSRQLDDQSRNEALSNLTGIPRTDELTLKPSTDFFGIPGNPKVDLSSGSVNVNSNDDSKVVDLRPRQGYSAEAAAPANPGGALPLIMGDPDAAPSQSPNTDSNVVDLRDKKAPLAEAQHESARTSEESLFPGKGTFPKNPDKPLLNPLIELPKAESLPTKGETADEFFARLGKTNLVQKITDEENRDLFLNTIAGGGTPYPRGQNPAVDKIVDRTVKQIGEREEAGIHEACQKAVDNMNAEWAKMEQQGIIHAGEDLKKKEETDVVYENALMSARQRVYDQLDKDIRSAKVRSDVALDKLRLFLDDIHKDKGTPAELLGGPSPEEYLNQMQKKWNLNNTE